MGKRQTVLKKKTAQVVSLLASGNLWMTRRKLLECVGRVRVQGA
jgi:IS5 family transposase